MLRAIGRFECFKGHQQLRGPCPFHATKRPGSRSFSVNLCKDVYRCLDPDCNAHGNPLDLWAAFHQLPLYEAVLDLAKQFQLTLQPDQRRGNP
ncbi:MAG: hypothetical protein KDB23_01055 [Planctomycetales bacterium]|nr:hypothetical protein [Planctomycetales bacterium]